MAVVRWRVGLEGAEPSGEEDVRSWPVREEVVESRGGGGRHARPIVRRRWSSGEEDARRENVGRTLALSHNRSDDRGGPFTIAYPCS
jgi:hypothetical protein